MLLILALRRQRQENLEFEASSSTEQVLGKPGLHWDVLSLNKTKGVDTKLSSGMCTPACTCTTGTSGAAEAWRRHQIFWNWRWLWAVKWILTIKPGSSGGAASFIDELPSQPQNPLKIYLTFTSVLSAYIKWFCATYVGGRKRTCVLCKSS